MVYTSVMHWWSALPDEPECSLPPTQEMFKNDTASCSSVVKRSVELSRKNGASNVLFLQNKRAFSLSHSSFLSTTFSQYTHEIRCLSISVLKKKLLNFWPGSHMCHWLAQKQQTNCVFLCGWMNVRKLVRICGESHNHHLLFLSMDVSCMWHFIPLPLFAYISAFHGTS